MVAQSHLEALWDYLFEMTLSSTKIGDWGAVDSCMTINDQSIIYLFSLSQSNNVGMSKIHGREFRWGVTVTNYLGKDKRHCQ